MGAVISPCYERPPFSAENYGLALEMRGSSCGRSSVAPSSSTALLEVTSNSAAPTTGFVSLNFVQVALCAVVDRSIAQLDNPWWLSLLFHGRRIERDRCVADIILLFLGVSRFSLNRGGSSDRGGLGSGMEEVELPRSLLRLTPEAVEASGVLGTQGRRVRVISVHGRCGIKLVSPVVSSLIRSFSVASLAHLVASPYENSPNDQSDNNHAADHGTNDSPLRYFRGAVTSLC